MSEEKAPTFLKKMSIKSLAGLPRDTSEQGTKKHFRELAAKLNGQHFLSITGMAFSYEVKAKGKYDKENICISGDFVARNNITGELFESNAIYLPSNEAGAIKGAIDRLSQGENVQFVYDVTVMIDESTDVGYTYALQPRRSPEAASKKKEMVKLLQDAKSIKLIDAPKTKAA